MRKLILGLMILGLFVSNAFAYMGTTTITASDGSVDIALTTAESVYTHSFLMRSKDPTTTAISYLITSVSTSPSINIQLQQSFKTPTTEGATDTYWTEPDGVKTIVTGESTETIKHATFDSITLPYGRFIIADTLPSTDVTINIWVTGME